MAATAATFSDQQLESELQKLQKEISSDEGKLQETRRRLDSAKADRSRIVDGVARGTVKDAEVSRIKGDIDLIETRIEGLNGLLASNRSKASVIQDELNRRANAAQAADRQKQFSELEARGKAAAMRIVEKLARVITEDIAEFDSIRSELGREFGKAGGFDAARRLVKMVYQHPGPNERVGVPDVHLRVLQGRGWVHAEAAQPDLARMKTDDGVFEYVPGGALQLTVVSMRPKK